MTSAILDELYARLKAKPYRKLANSLFLLFNQKASRPVLRGFLCLITKNRQSVLAMQHAYSL